MLDRWRLRDRLPTLLFWLQLPFTTAGRSSSFLDSYSVPTLPIHVAAKPHSDIEHQISGSQQVPETAAELFGNYNFNRFLSIEQKDSATHQGERLSLKSPGQCICWGHFGDVPRA